MAFDFLPSRDKTFSENTKEKDRIIQAREFWEREDRNFEEAQRETERLRENSDNFFFHDDFTYLDV